MNIYHIECLTLVHDGSVLSVPAYVMAYTPKGALLKFMRKTETLNDFPTIPMDTSFTCQKTASRRIRKYVSDNPRIIVQVTKEEKEKHNGTL